MEAKDLTLGSLIQYNGEIRFVAVLENGYIRTGKPDKKEYYNFAATSLFQPIPITREWLEKLGFSGEQNKYEYADSSGKLICSVHHLSTEAPTHILRVVDGHEHMCSLYVSHIHHLQSLVWNLERVWLTLQEF